MERQHEVSKRSKPYLHHEHALTDFTTKNLAKTAKQKLDRCMIEIKYLFNVSFRSKGYHKPKNQINETTSYWHSKPREGLEQVGAEADKNQEA